MSSKAPSQAQPKSRDFEIAIAILKSVTPKLTIDFNKFAEHAKLKNVGSAKTTYYTFKRTWVDDNLLDPALDTPATPKKLVLKLGDRSKYGDTPTKKRKLEESGESSSARIYDVGDYIMDEAFEGGDEAKVNNSEETGDVGTFIKQEYIE